MSFSGDLKTELSKQIDGARHCRIAEYLALRTFLEDAETGKIRTENRQVAEAYCLLLKKLFGLEVQPLAEKGRRGRVTYAVSIADAADEEKLRETAAHAIVQKDCCRRAYLRGAFLAAGSVSDPSRSYHCEIVCRSRAQAEQMTGILADLHIRAKIIQRKQHDVVYVKESSDLADMIGLMGARVSLMDYENVRILKEMRENVNRKVNCETANIHKTVSAAVRQIEDIRLIEETIGFRGLPKGLDEMARIRLQYPEATLQELGKMLNPQVGKSGVNHRLRKLGKIAEAIRGNQGGEREW